jgi:hypothetical protein
MNLNLSTSTFSTFPSPGLELELELEEGNSTISSLQYKSPSLEISKGVLLGMAIYLTIIGN